MKKLVGRLFGRKSEVELNEAPAGFAMFTVEDGNGNIIHQEMLKVETVEVKFEELPWDVQIEIHIAELTQYTLMVSRGLNEMGRMIQKYLPEVDVAVIEEMRAELQAIIEQLSNLEDLYPDLRDRLAFRNEVAPRVVAIFEQMRAIFESHLDDLRAAENAARLDRNS